MPSVATQDVGRCMHAGRKRLHLCKKCSRAVSREYAAVAHLVKARTSLWRPCKVTTVYQVAAVVGGGQGGGGRGARGARCKIGRCGTTQWGP